MRPKKPLISLVLPLYNEAGNLVWHHGVISKFFNTNNLAREIIYVDDGSSDDSLRIIREISRSDPKVKYLSLSRNFGKEAATTAGIKSATGDVVIVMDADGQHPIEKVTDFLEEWGKGADVVIGLRIANQKEGFVKRYGSKLHNFLLNSLTDTKTIHGATDFRLIDRKVVDEFNKLTERNRITRGLIDWLGFKRSYIEFMAPARHSGEATYTFGKLARLALHSFTSQSTKPLQATGFLGFIVTLVSFLAGVVLVTNKYLLNDPLRLSITGTGLLAIFLSFLVGLVLICQWLLAIYVENIHNETQNRPLFIVSDQSK